MNLQNVLDKIDDFTEEERIEYLTKVFDMFCPISTKTIMNFQNEWGEKTYPNYDFEGFIKEQNKQIKMCIKLECSEVGKIVRKTLNLTPITLETEL